MIEKKEFMPISDCEVRDPRMKRTRQLLQNALRGLLRDKPLDEIGVQEIAEAATVNRATFYDHYTDKFALFNAMIASDFHQTLARRNIQFDGSCSSALANIILAVCDYLGCHRDQSGCSKGAFGPLIDNAITLAIRHTLAAGLSTHESAAPVPREVIASAAGSAIYGAVKEWFASACGPPDPEAVAALVRLVHPLLQAAAPRPEPASTE
jgi:AcrR family transcriptional regulator